MKIHRLKSFFVIFLCGALTLSLTACPKKKLSKKTAEELAEEEKEEIPPEEEWSESEELDIRGKDFVSSKELSNIRFDYDSPTLSDEAREILARNAEFLKKNKQLEILIEGHCDERGTIGYNLALGQKRAIAVRKYYMSLGIRPKRMGSLSYGKEKPDCIQSTEDCWYQNRRAETKVREPKIIEKPKPAEDKPKEGGETVKPDDKPKDTPDPEKVKEPESSP